MEAYQRPRTPLVVWLLTGSIVLAYLAYVFAPADTQRFIEFTFALIPERFHADSPYRFQHWWEAFGPLLGHTFLHTGWLHLGANALFLFGASRWPALRLGTTRYLVVYLSAVLTGAAVFLALNWNAEAVAVGASGGVCGMITAFFFSTRRTWREALADPQVRGPLGALFVLNVVVMGIASKAGIFPIAWEAHLGGFVGGG
ncbi:MAG: rhomboid family intramembrane serine protease, partial [Hyphomonadaceae bacterium]|nr:rhomboid family intramembrane serine protease [Hyphomonadaceae bacterium]